jgi:DNA-binding MarR family transcriptional regulator
MRKALEDAGYDDVPKNGLFIIGGLALEGREAPLSRLIEELGISKQSAGQLVDTLVTRGYLERNVDPEDRRRLVITLTDRGRDAVRVQSGARERIDHALENRVGENGMSALRKVLAALAGLKNDTMTQAGTPSPMRITAAIPILFAQDVVRAADYYKDACGFRIDFLHGEPPFYASVSRGDARLHLRFVKKPNFPELAAREISLILATFEVTDIKPSTRI